MDKFNYTYSAPTDEERRVIEAIRREFDGETEKNTMSKLRDLEKKVRRPAELLAYLFGIIGTLLLGTGMSMSMTDIGGGVVWGSVVGIVGIAMLAVNYKLYKAVLTYRKNKYADEVRKLTDGLLNGKK